MYSTVENKVLLVQGKKTISLATTISKKQELQIFQTTLVQPLLEPSKYMGARRPLAACPRPEVFSTIFTEETNTD